MSMITEIGIVAGEIWHALDTRGEVNLNELVEFVKRPRELVLMSLGWLAREGHVLVRFENNEFRASLRK